METLSVKKLIEALQSCDQDASVVINVKQHNKLNGVVQLYIQDTSSNMPYQMFVDHTYGGCAITVHLPINAYIANLPK